MRNGKVIAVIFLAMILFAQGIASASGFNDESACLGSSAAREVSVTPDKPEAKVSSGRANGSRAAFQLSGDPETDAPSSRENILDQFFAEFAQQPPSELFASGAVFDIVRLNHETFEQVVQSSDAYALLQFFSAAYSLFCENPEVAGLPSGLFDRNNEDTNPAYWNADLCTLSNGDVAALCYMPVQSDSVEARIFGIVLSDQGDRYYYCMLGKDEDAYSDVMQNKALYGVEKVGEIKGSGFELMDAFLACMEG